MVGKEEAQRGIVQHRDLPFDEEIVLVRYGALVASRFGSGRISLGTCGAAAGQLRWTAA
jgi:hypothetical protein